MLVLAVLGTGPRLDARGRVADGQAARGGTRSAEQVSLVVARATWVRETQAGQASTMACVTFDNPAPLPVSVTGMEVEGAGTAEFHDVEAEGDRTARRRVLAFSIPARGLMELKPGGLHIVLSGLARAYAPGDRPLVTFRFDDGTFLMVRAEVHKRPVP